jgi:ribosomal-protein-alanine N-acetyltransferase
VLSGLKIIEVKKVQRWQKWNFPKLFPKMETERIILMEITDDDAEAILRNFSDPEITRWFLEQLLTNIEQAGHFAEQFNAEFEQGKGLTWAIVMKEINTCIGTCGYGFVEIGRQGEIGFDLAKEC